MHEPRYSSSLVLSFLECPSSPPASSHIIYKNIMISFGSGLNNLLLLCKFLLLLRRDAAAAAATAAAARQMVYIFMIGPRKDVARDSSQVVNGCKCDAQVRYSSRPGHKIKMKTKYVPRVMMRKREGTCPEYIPSCPSRSFRAENGQRLRHEA